jgi:tetratricopeptide (TPR) repeat protein
MSNKPESNEAALCTQMAGYLESQGDLKGALDMYSKLLKIYFQTVGHTHHSVAETYSKVSNLLETVGNKNGAKIAKQKSQETYHNLFTLLYQQGKLEESYRMYNKSRGDQMEEASLHSSSMMSCSSITSAMSSPSKLRKETKSFLETLRNYLDCRKQMNSKYLKVDKRQTIANYEVKEDSGGIETDTNGQFKAEYQQQSIHGEPVKTLDELYEAAKEAKPVFYKLIQKLVKQVCDACDSKIEDVVADRPTLKRRKRAKEKAEDDYAQRQPGPGVSWLYDIVRGSVKFASAAQVKKFVQLMRKKKSIHIVKAKNRFQNPSLTGYRDLNIHFQISIDNKFKHICEIQVHHKAIKELDTELDSHKYYEYFRRYFAGATGSLNERLDDLTLISQGALVNKSFLNDLLEKSTDVERLERLANLFEKQLCEYDWALRVYGKLVELQSANLGANHPLTGGLYSNIADVLQSKGSMEESLNMYRKSLDICLRSLGETHPAIVRLMFS